MNNIFDINNPFEREIKGTQSKLHLIRKEDNQQSSYNLSLELMNYLINKNVITKEITPPNTRDEIFGLSEGVSLVLDKNVMDIIGESYKNINFKIRFVHTIANDNTEKFQIKRKMHDSDNKSLNWFKTLYDYNVEGSIFSIYYDEGNKVLHINNFMNYKKLSSIENLDEVELSLKDFYIKNLNNNTFVEEEINNRNAFVEEYPINRLLSLSLEEYCLGLENFKDSFSYKLEFGKYKKTAFGMGGGASGKHGIYFSGSDNKFHGKNNKVIEDEEVESYFLEFKKQLVSFIVQMGKEEPNFNIDEKYPLLGGSGSYMFLTKLLSLYYPDRFISMSKNSMYSKLNKYLDIADQDNSVKNSYYSNIAFRKNIPEANNNHGFYISNAIWQYFEEDEEVNSDYDIPEDKDYDIEFLAKELKEYRDKYGYIGIHLFGIKYGRIIENTKISKKDLIIKAGLKVTMEMELNKGINLSSYANLLKNPIGKIDIIEEITEDSDDENNRIKGAFNKIYYGVPGSGKSHTVDVEFNKEDYKIHRTTFHPEYTNSDFVGQIIPTVVDGKVEYTFHPGAFTKALEYALENKSEKVCLIIEEINRGNSSAIFGDIFQLLDRNVDGRSRYGIYNGPIIDYLAKKGITLDEILIPSNLWIVATMNTSDQNVFTLDTAFKRRWKMEYIKNVFAENEESKKLKEKILPLNDRYKNITWNTFVNKINKHIIEDPSGINAEDKQLGMYFVSIDEIDNQKEFAEKILSYIWEDVAKLNTSYWFGTISSYDELLDSYNKNYLDVFNNLFEDEITVIEDEVIKTVGE